MFSLIKMKLPTSGVLAGALLVMAVVLTIFVVSRDESPPPPVAETRGSKPSSEARTKAEMPQKAAPAPEPEKATDETREAAIEEMHEAAITYDPAQLRVIQPYLLHSDPELRHAAREAMLVLGDASASPMLREAAKSAASTREALQYEEAAEFLELPRGKFKKLNPDADPTPGKTSTRR